MGKIEKPDLDQQAAYYDKWWTEGFEIGQLTRYELLRISRIFYALSFLEFGYGIKRPDLRICDLGCGRGWISSQLTAVGKVTGIDLSPKGIEKASRIWPQVNFLCADILEYQANEKFDIIITSEVIEHIPEQNRFVESIARNLKSNGFLILTCPNALAKPVMEKGGLVTQPIENWLTRKQIRELFSNEFEILELSTFALDYSYFGIHRILSAPKILRFLKIIHLLSFYNFLRESLGLGLHHLVIARRKSV